MKSTGGAEPRDFGGIGAQPLNSEDPRAIGGFPLVAVLGEGGMGRVYLAVTPRGYGAVKRIVPSLAHDRQFLERFEHELDNQARMPAGVSARVLATDKTAQPPWFVTEYIPGLTLHEAVYGEGGSLPPSSVWRLFHELASRLKIVHAFDVTHRDLKPSNVILTADGCRIIDFGIARAADQSPITVKGHVIGTPRYMAPEQASGDGTVGVAADIYALAATVVFAATGLPPFGEASGDVLRYCVMNKDPDLDAVRELDAELADVLEPCFDRDPAARPSAAELAERAHARAAQARTWPTQSMAGIYQRKAFAEAFRPIAPQSTALDPVGDPAIGADAVEPAIGSGSSSSSSSSDPVDPPRSQPSGESKPGKRPRKQSRKLLIVPLVLTVTAGTGTATYLLTGPTPSKRSLSAAHSSTSATGRASSSTSAKPSSSASPKVSTVGSAVSTTRPADTNTTTTTTQTTSAPTASTTTTAAHPAGAAPSQMAGFNYNYPDFCAGACDPFPVVVSWTAQSDATSYDIHYQNTTRGIDQVINVKGTSYTINTTNSGDHYCLQMRADNQYGDSIWKPTSDSSDNCFDVPY